MSFVGLGRRLIRAGQSADDNYAAQQQNIIRNTILLVTVMAGSVASITLLAIGDLFYGALPGIVAFACLVGFGLCARGFRFAGVALALLAVNGVMVTANSAMGPGQVEILYVATISLPFSFFGAAQRRLVMLWIGVAFVGICMGEGLLPHGWVTRGDDARFVLRIAATAGICFMVAGQLWLDFTVRNQVLAQITGALEDAEAANRAKSAFLANTSHEIRTPMNGVLGMLDLVLDTPLEAHQRDYCETARESALSLLDIIDDILDISRAEAGELRFEPSVFNLHAMVEDVLDQNAVRADTKGIELILDYADDAPEEVVADMVRVRQVIVNLVGNALKFTERGHVLVSVACRECHGDRAVGDRVVSDRVVLELAVSDTGPGIPEAMQGVIFDKFKQVDDSTSRNHTGTGLGLAISREFVTRMGGEIGLRSEPGPGSTFFFTLPTEWREPRDEAPAAVSELAGVRVLVVDDNTANRTILDKQLGRFGMRVQACESARQALEVAHRAADQGTPFGMAVLDFHMPEVDGLELARTIKADARLQAMVIVLLTSVVVHDREAIEQAGVAGYLNKPPRRAEFVNILATTWQLRDQEHAPITRYAARRQSITEPRRFGAPRLLVVDDNEINLKVATRLLDSLGCQVDGAVSGPQALERARKTAYDIIFMDVQMPGMDGLQATERIRARENESTGGGGARVPIIALTAHAMEGDRAQCLAAGMDDYISKPLRRDQLIAALDRFLATPGDVGDAGAGDTGDDDTGA